VPFLLAAGRVNLISNTRTTLKIVIRQSRPWVTPFSTTVQVPHPIPGSFASRMFASSLTLRFHLHSMVESLSSAPPVLLPTISARCSGSDSWNPPTTNLMIPLLLQNHVKIGTLRCIAENVGHFMTFKILNEDTKKIIFCSNVRSALDPKAKNLRLDPLSGETSIPVIIKNLVTSLIPVITKSINARPCPFSPQRPCRQDIPDGPNGGRTTTSSTYRRSNRGA
jgi:hypothetical protein